YIEAIVTIFCTPFPTRRVSELGGIQLEQYFTAGPDRFAERVDARQQSLEEEPGSTQLGLIETVGVLCCVQRTPGHACPHVGVGGVTEGMQILDRRSADFLGAGAGTL